MKEVIIPQAELRSLPEYSCTLPTGTTIGKRWRRRTPYRSDSYDWMIGEYTDIGDPDNVGVSWAWACAAPGEVHRGPL